MTSRGATPNSAVDRVLRTSAAVAAPNEAGEFTPGKKGVWLSERPLPPPTAGAGAVTASAALRLTRGSPMLPASGPGCSPCNKVGTEFCAMNTKPDLCKSCTAHKGWPIILASSHSRLGRSFRPAAALTPQAKS